MNTFFIPGNRAGDNPVYGLRGDPDNETALTTFPKGSAQTEYVNVLPNPNEELEHKFDSPIYMYTSIKNTGPSELSAGRASSTATSVPIPRLDDDDTPANANGNGNTYQVIECSDIGDNCDRAAPDSVEHKVNNPLYGSGNEKSDYDLPS